MQTCYICKKPIEKDPYTLKFNGNELYPEIEEKICEDCFDLLCDISEDLNTMKERNLLLERELFLKIEEAILFGEEQ